MLLEKNGEITPERMKREPKQKHHPVVDVTGDGSKIRCCKEQYCIGTWNVMSMNQGKLEVVKQEMALGGSISIPFGNLGLQILFNRYSLSTFWVQDTWL